VPAWIGNLQAETLIDLFAGLYIVRDPLAVLEGAATPLVEGELGVDQFPVLGEQKDDSVVIPALLVCGQSNDDVAVRNEALVLETDQVRDVNRTLVLVVCRAAAVEEAVRPWLRQLWWCSPSCAWY